MDHLDYTELRSRLESLEAEQKEVERIIANTRDQRRAELISEFKQRIKDEGFLVADFADAFGARRYTRRSFSGVRSYQRYVDNSDPECFYIRGPLPAWMRDRMRSVGLDPAVRSDRERYKQDYMHIKD